MIRGRVGYDTLNVFGDRILDLLAEVVQIELDQAMKLYEGLVVCEVEGDRASCFLVSNLTKTENK